MEITESKSKGRGIRQIVNIINIQNIDELLELMFNRALIKRQDWRGWHVDVSARCQTMIDTITTITLTNFDLYIRFEVLNPTRKLQLNNPEYWERRGWRSDDAVAHIKHTQRTKNRISKQMYTVEYWMQQGLDEVNATEKANKHRFHGSPKRVEYWLTKGLSEQEAKEAVSRVQRQSSPRSLEYWKLRGVDEANARVEILNRQTHSAAAAAEKWKQGLMDKSTRNTNIDYWIRKTNGDVELAKQKQKERQTTFSLKKCIEKHGVEEGIERWKARQGKWQKNFKKQNYSRVSQELFVTVVERLQIPSGEAIFATCIDNGKNNEVSLELNHSYCRPDFYIPSIGAIVEFDGEYWHRTGHSNYLIECQQRDNVVKKKYPNMKIFHVDEKEYRKNREQVTQKVVDFIEAAYLSANEHKYADEH
jgi:hypothetical protein